MKKLLRLSILLLILPLAALATTQPATPNFTAGTDYQVLNVNKVTPDDAGKGQVEVIEFFSYGCPWCFRLEPLVEKWLQTKPKNVVFKRVPVIFESGWDVYAKAYYTANALGVDSKLTPAIFNAIHNQNQNLTTATAMSDFFVRQGVSKKDFDNAFNYSPSIGILINNGTQLMQAYQVYEIPTFVIAGKYKTSANLAKGDNQRLLQIVDFLITKAAKENS